MSAPPPADAPRRWLSVVGIGEDGLDGLGALARRLIERAEVLVGGARHLAMLPDDGRERLQWSSPIAETLDAIVALRGRRVCVLASGDPMHYGIGAHLTRRIPPEETIVLPAPSAFSLAAARLGWPLAEVDCLTVHGRPLALVEPFVQPGARLLILANDGKTPGEIAALLRRRGFGPSAMAALERMGGGDERIRRARAEDWPGERCADLVTVAVECRAGPDAILRPRLPGLPDEAFANDGQLTKREVRAMTLAALAPTPGARLWDVGAGCGSVAIEWLRSDRRCRAVAVERAPERIEMIAANAGALGVPGLEIVHGEAPAALDGLPPPDAVFVGGGVRTPGLLDACWRALAPGGRLVANAVTIDGEAALAAFHGRHGGELRRIAVSRAAQVGRFAAWRPLVPVTQYAAVKP